MSPFDLRLGARGDRQHPLVQIEADHPAVLPDPGQSLAGEYAGTAAHFEDLVARADPRGVGNRAGPGAKDRRHKARLIDLGSIGRDLPLLRLSHLITPLPPETTFQICRRRSRDIFRPPNSSTPHWMGGDARHRGAARESEILALVRHQYPRR